MKPIYAAALLALGAGGCVDSQPTLQLFQATPPDATCAVSTTATGGLLRGSLDTVYGQADYRMGFLVRTTLSSEPVTVGDTPVDDEDALTVYVNELEVSYESEPDIGLEDASVPIYGVFQSGTQGALLLPLFTNDAQAALLSATNSGQVVEVLATVTLKGEAVGGGNVESNEVTFPLTVFRSDPATVCPSGQRPGPSVGPCDPRGQNGAQAACVAIPTTP